MGQIIAGVYQIEQRIGSGGGGIVYLGTHLRLNKRVVLKADKRSLNTKPEILRREVDMLKGLSHTYIPQVYDFIQEDGIVYTVMDYIEGESLDHILERGQTPPQSQLIQWACQLLEALAYLHSRPPHGILHADIKPANIMLRTNGDICLIDYNIALALGEDGAIKVGYSRGYASPEHYGSDGGVGTELSENQGKKLDVRSDIYSLGATLYHLISGEKPAQRAEDVKPLKSDVCSPSVSAIIQKAMAPEPDNRYQSAEEMLTAFRQLPVRDRRMVLHRRRIRCSVAVLTVLFLLGGSSTFVGLKQMEQRQTALKLAEYSADERSQGNIDKAVELALQAIPKENKLWNAYLYHVSGASDLYGNLQEATQPRKEQFNTDAESIMELYEILEDRDFSKLQDYTYQGSTTPKDLFKDLAGAMLSEGASEAKNQIFSQIVARPMISGYIGADSKGNSADSRLQTLRVKGGLSGIDLSASSFFEDGSTIDLVACYTIDPIMPIDIMPELNLCNRAVIQGMGGSSVFK